jgi:hypothetical protein
MKERCVNVLVLKIEWETAKNNCGSDELKSSKKRGGSRVEGAVLKTDG